jgi:hypothetical protein
MEKFSYKQYMKDMLKTKPDEYYIKQQQEKLKKELIVENKNKIRQI